MKDTLKKFLIKITPILIINFIFIGLHMYLLTLSPKILGQIIDYLYDQVSNYELIITSIKHLLIVSLLIIITRVVWKACVQAISRGFEKHLKCSIFNRFLEIKLDSIQNIKNGEIMSYLTKDIGELRRFGYSIANQLVRLVFTFLIAIYTMKNVNPLLTILVMIPLLITISITMVLKNYIEKSFRTSQEYFTSLSEYVQESTDAIRTTKAYAAEDYQTEEFIEKNRNLMKANIKVDMYQALLYTSIFICFGICYSITLIYGSHLVLNGIITVGALVAFAGYLELFINPMMWLPRIINRIKRAQVSYERLDKLFKLETEKLIELPEPNKISGDIEFKNFTFHYPSFTEEVLKDINLKIPENSTLGIIGTIGSGKTTLVNSILRLYDIENGKIFIGGKDINDLEVSKLRTSICFITQENFLFSNTIKNNVTLFQNETFKDNEVIDSITRAEFKEDIDKLSDGINTVIGDRGIDLSGGQKQRVVLSRSFLNKSNILIFDDTFSALDNKTEEKLLKQIKELKENKTCIIISNRISDIKDADNIIVLDDGKIVESGTHKMLLKNKKLYHNFYMQQSSKED